jgi:chitin disaccharide deacetylase
VSSLVDERGYFHGGDRIPELLAAAKVDEVELEFRTQIDAVLAEQLRPTHLDWHSLADGGREDIFELTLELAREYGLALRIHDRSHAERCRQAGVPVNDHDVLDSYRLDTDDKPARYAQLMRELPAGLSEWAVHPSLGNAEAQALEPNSWKVRKSDFEYFTSREAREQVEHEGITLLDYRALQPHWSG